MLAVERLAPHVSSAACRRCRATTRRVVVPRDVLFGASDDEDVLDSR